MYVGGELREEEWKRKNDGVVRTHGEGKGRREPEPG